MDVYLVNNTTCEVRQVPYFEDLDDLADFLDCHIGDMTKSKTDYNNRQSHIRNNYRLW